MSTHMSIHMSMQVVVCTVCTDTCTHANILFAFARPSPESMRMGDMIKKTCAFKNHNCRGCCTMLSVADVFSANTFELGVLLCTTEMSSKKSRTTTTKKRPYSGSHSPSPSRRARSPFFKKRTPQSFPVPGVPAASHHRIERGTI